MNKVVEVSYEVQGYIPPENAIDGISYWTSLRLQDGKLSTSNREYARSCLGTAKGIYSEGTVRLVQVEKKSLSFEEFSNES